MKTSLPGQNSANFPPASTLLSALRQFRQQHPFPSRSTLASITSEQFHARAAEWDRRRAEDIATMEADPSWQAFAATCGLEEVE